GSERAGNPRGTPPAGPARAAPPPRGLSSPVDKLQPRAAAALQAAGDARKCRNAAVLALLNQRAIQEAAQPRPVRLDADVIPPPRFDPPRDVTAKLDLRASYAPLDAMLAVVPAAQVPPGVVIAARVHQDQEPFRPAQL